MAEDYRFESFKREMLAEDMGFQGGPPPGAPFPDFALPTVAGGQVTKSDFVDRQPMLMIFSSFT